MQWDANSLSARMLHLLHQFVPDLYSVTLFLPTSSNTTYSLSGIGRFDTILLCPHEDGQEQRLSSASIKFLWLRQIHDPSGISPALDNALSTLLSCCSQQFFSVRVLASFIHLLPVVTLSDNDSKQIAAATLSHAGSFNTKNFFSEGQKNLVNSENKENLSNYQLFKRKPSVCSTSLHFSKLITVDQFFFSHDTGSATVSLNLRGKFSRPATGYECIAHALAFDHG